MMVNLFSSFDPSSSLGSLNWISLILFMFIIPSTFFFKSFKTKMICSKVVSFFLKETNMIIKENKIFNILMSGLFFLIIVNNFLGLFPYVFTATSHMNVTMTFSIILWVALMLFGWGMKNKDMFAHLVPMSTPPVLMPFMVLIESISSVIRPLTLAIRLSANMIAGHLLLTLLGNQLAELSMLGLMIPTEIMLVMLEMAVSLIQAYVFSILLTLYISEVSEKSHYDN